MAQDRNDYQGAVELIDGMSGKLIFTGMGKSGIIGEKIGRDLFKYWNPFLLRASR